MIYPDDIQSAAEDMFGADNIDLQHTSQNRHDLVIYWDEIEVSNENDEKHTIYDMYVKVTFSSDYELIGFKLTRTTLTLDELKARYVFSHVQRLTTNLDYAAPCLGRGPIRNTMASLAKKYDPDLFRLFLVELDRYVRTESIDGGPYVRMSLIGNSYTIRYDIGPINANQDIDNKARDLYNYIKRKCPIKPVSIRNGVDFGDLYKLVRKVSVAALDYINTLSINQSLIDGFFSVASINDGIIYIGNQLSIMDPDSIYVPVVFKGVHKELKIKYYDAPQNDMLVVKPNIMSGVLSLMYLDYYTKEFEFEEDD